MIMKSDPKMKRFTEYLIMKPTQMKTGKSMAITSRLKRSVAMLGMTLYVLIMEMKYIEEGRTILFHIIRMKRTLTGSLI